MKTFRFTSIERAVRPAMLLAGAAFIHAAQAQLVISDTLSGTSSSYDWISLNGACLTAGNQDPGGATKIPGCKNLKDKGVYYKSNTLVGGKDGAMPDSTGNGALRLTNGDTTSGSNGDYQSGAVVSNFTFPVSQGLDVTFKTVTYGGDNLNNHGADGISFFLADGALPPSIGGLGGSLGYSCSNGNPQYDGVRGGYIGIGIDEYGNFSNSGDNTNTGPGFGAGRITVRGAGSTNFADLSTNATTKASYPTSLTASQRESAVKTTCQTGTIRNTSTKLTYNYPYLTHKDVGEVIANQQATSVPKRSSARPITYSLRITQDGFLSFLYSINGGVSQTVFDKYKITDNNGPLPASFRFGFSAGTGLGSNVHEIMCFKAAQIGTSASSVGLNAQQSAKVQVGSQVYLAYYNPQNWWGQLAARNLVLDPSTDIVSINPVANWDASCVLTGGACGATNKTSGDAQASANRGLLSWNGSTGIALQWGSLSATQKSALDASAASATSSTRLNYLRGVRSDEIQTPTTGKFRKRTGVLGDIVNASPAWVGPPSSPYEGRWQDRLYPSAQPPEGTSYAAFSAGNAARTNVVYAGANDGFMHAFRAGAYKADGSFDKDAANDGRELLAYMPARVVETIYSAGTPALDFSSTQYAHNAYVDATPGTGDLYYQGAWHTWLVGGLGAGGNAAGVIGDKTSIATGTLFALEITDPGNFAEANAAGIVLGEWNSANLNCTGDSIASMCRDSLGSIYGTPIIRRLHDGHWAVIFGNGLNSKSGKAGIYVMTVDQNTGGKSFRFLPTSAGAALAGTAVTMRNGIVQLTSADLDGDHVTDYVYAGDARGNLWRFDLTSNDPARWAAGDSALFTTPSGQPITTRPTVIASSDGNDLDRIVVSFGTGQILPQTLTAAAVPEPAGQSIYGVWDWDMGTWNAKSSRRYVSLAAPQRFTDADLTAQTMSDVAYANGDIFGARTVTRNAVCWKGRPACGSGNARFGWKLALTGAKEQIVYNPIFVDGLFVVNTTIPATTQVLSCEQQPASGYTMAISPDTGGAPSSSYFKSATTGANVAADAVIAGIGLSGVGSPGTVTGEKKKFLVTQNRDGDGSTVQVDPQGNVKGKRLTWIKLR